MNNSPPKKKNIWRPRFKIDDIVYLNAYYPGRPDILYICQAKVLILPVNYVGRYQVQVIATSEQPIGQQFNPEVNPLLGLKIAKPEKELFKYLNPLMQPKGWVCFSEKKRSKT